MEITVRFPNLGFLFEYEDRAFSVFGFEITIYGILIMAALLVGTAVILLTAKRQRMDPNRCLGAAIAAFLGGVIGARLYYLAFAWGQLNDHSWKSLCDIRSGGMAIYGAILGGALAMALFCRVSRVSFWNTADLVCMGLLSGQILGVWGNFFNRDSFGEYTDSLFAMGLPLDSVQSSTVTALMKKHLTTFRDMKYIQVHPLFLYESIWCLLLLFVLVAYSRKKKFQGEIFLRYLAGYGLGKCVFEWLRTDKLYIPGTKIPVSLLISAVLFVVCSIVATVRRILSKKRETVSRRRKEA
ncbi:prolipoprotein diacylglyceryl transferase [Blautia sp. MSJ-19]|uniref:prolipoprotein diacylglyceryl transferase n=1 Tax=Blautia sp. MSJ-19 TaxID=2841517 RepID=UPI001C0EC697|nr:prolipoprotein diacylglyceryl transferase [Blautia sp. MSJ-19]MBU5480420.1 prolipoprotein diacylglyceryl transferase [Blautia sp. MSJ-19]